MFKIKDGHKWELQTPENYENICSTNIRQNKEWRKCTEARSGWSSFNTTQFVYNQYQQNSKVLHTLTPNKSYPYLLNVETSNLAFLNT